MTMYVVGPRGHETLEFTDNDEDMAAAAELFDAQRSAGWMPFGSAGTELFWLADFDPGVAEVYWVRPLVGG